jgi:hypothetical protein
VFACARCGKRVCPQHAWPLAADTFACVSCAHERDYYDAADTDNDSDPYFYAADYRSRSGFTETADPKDFQQGDRAALAEDEGGGWEDDAGGS